jgi:uncharacterized protein (DUF2336 family)
MAATASVIEELEQSIAGGTNDRRVEILRKVTDLFLLDAPQFDEAQVGLFDDVIGKLAAEIETSARAELARRLAPVGNAPRDVVHALARDEAIAVAGPILQQSTALSDEFLVEIAQTRGQSHLLAISGRETIAPVVTDVLVTRGDSDVVRKVAANDGASFSVAGYTRLVERAATDETLAEKVGLRRDITPHQFRALLAHATERVRGTLMRQAEENGGGHRDAILAAVAGSSEQISREMAPIKRDYGPAQRVVLTLHRSGKLTEAEVVAFAKAMKFEESVVSVSAQCGIAIEVVERLMLGERPDPILILARSQNYAWDTVKALIMSRPGGITSGGLDEAYESYNKLSAATAQRVMRFWQVRQSATGKA